MDIDQVVRDRLLSRIIDNHLEGKGITEMIDDVGVMIGKTCVHDEAWKYTVADMIMREGYTKSPDVAWDAVETCIRKAKEIIEAEKQALIETGEWAVMTPVKVEPVWEVVDITSALEKPPATEWQINEVIEASTLNLVYGQPGGHKSNILMDMGFSIASGKPWLPNWGQDSGRSYDVTQGAVFWLDMDNGRQRMQRRVHAFLNAHIGDKRGPLPNFTYTSMPSPWLDIGQPDAYDLLMRQIEATEATFMVIDNLGLILGDIDENSSEVARALAPVRRVVDATGCTINIIHHERKGAAGHSGRRGENVRGSSSIEAALDMAYAVEVDQKNTTNIIFKQTKNRGFGVGDVKARLMYEWYPDTKDWRWARFYNQPDAGEMSDEDYTRRIIMYKLRQVDSIGQEEMLIECKEIEGRDQSRTSKISINRMRKIAKGMADMGEIESIRLDHNKIAYSALP